MTLFTAARAVELLNFYNAMFRQAGKVTQAISYAGRTSSALSFFMGALAAHWLQPNGLIISACCFVGLYFSFKSVRLIEKEVSIMMSMRQTEQEILTSDSQEQE